MECGNITALRLRAPVSQTENSRGERRFECFPVCPRKQTLRYALGMSVSCQKRTHSSQQESFIPSLRRLGPVAKAARSARPLSQSSCLDEVQLGRPLYW